MLLQKPNKAYLKLVSRLQDRTIFVEKRSTEMNEICEKREKSAIEIIKLELCRNNFVCTFS